MKNSFQLWPAIDLIDGKPVRLLKGDYGKKTDYSDQFSLKSLSNTFSQFAHGIHVVDLDGAKAGKPKNIQAISDIIKNTSLPIETGGGIRVIEDANTLFDIGVSRIILGTSAIKNPDFLKKCLHTFGKERVVVGVDAKDGFVATHGWEKTSEMTAEIFLKTLENDFGVQTIIFTDIATDGTLQGPPLHTFRKLTNNFPNLDIIASGGVAKKKDIEDLQEIGTTGVIFGKAFYEEKITKEELVHFSQNNA